MSRGLLEALKTLCERGHLARALEVLSHLHTHAPTSSYISLFTACGKSRALTLTRLLYAHLFLLGTRVTPLLSHHLVLTLTKCGAVHDALHVPYSLSHRTVFSWTSIISAFASSGYGIEALRVYHFMLQDGIEPDHYTFVSLFKACGSIPDLVQGRALHADARQRGFIQDLFMASTLIVMYSKCGSLVEAENVFDALKEHDIVTWNSMLAAYVDHGERNKALQFYFMMEETGLSPNDRTYVPALQACATMSECGDAFYFYEALTELTPLQIGQVLHADAEMKGCTQNAFVGNCLISMYGGCGAIVEAEYVFASLQERTNTSWNAMLSVYVNQGHVIKAFGCYSSMVLQGSSPDQIALVSAFQACAIFGEKGEGFLVNCKSTKFFALEVGQALHSSARSRGYMSVPMVCNTLISFYGKCGAVAEAEHVFRAMAERNEISWNAMLSTYNEQGEAKRSLQLYTQMELEGVSPDEGTLVLTFQACAILGEREEFVLENGELMSHYPLYMGYALHTEALMKGFTAYHFVIGTLISMYGKCGAIVEAEYVFCIQFNHNLVIWNAMISAFVTQGQEFNALQLYRQMQEEGVAPDQQTYATTILACTTLTEKDYAPSERLQINIMSLEIGRALHADAKHRCLTFDAFVGSSLVSIYAKHGSISEVEHAFQDVTYQDTVSWNAMLSAYAVWGMEREALQLFVQMMRENVTSNQQTMVIVLQACAGISEKEFTPLTQGELLKGLSLGIAQVLHECAANDGYTCNAIVGSALVSLYSKLGAHVEAELVFAEIPHRTVVTWSAMISAHVDQGEGLKALHLYRQMQGHSVAANHITITCILQACIGIESLESCERLHFEIVSVGYDHIRAVSASLIHAYGTQASMLDVQALLDKLIEADMVSWNACTGGHAGRGDCVASLQMLELLNCGGYKPDESTLTLVLAACSRAGMVAEGLEYLVSSRQDYNMCQDSKHYATILDLLGRAGDFSRAKNLLEKMPPKADKDTLLSLLGACRSHGNPELARQAFDIAINMGHKQATAYVLMSNVYADMAMQDYEDCMLVSG